MSFLRITTDPNQMAGVPCIRGLRIPVSTVLGMLADGMSRTEILEAFPDLEDLDITESLRFAAGGIHPGILAIRKSSPSSQAIQKALDLHRWNRRKAAESLGISYSAIRRYIEEYRLDE